MVRLLLLLLFAQWLYVWGCYIDEVRKTEWIWSAHIEGCACVTDNRIRSIRMQCMKWMFFVWTRMNIFFFRFVLHNTCAVLWIRIYDFFTTWILTFQENTAYQFCHYPIFLCHAFHTRFDLQCSFHFEYTVTVFRHSPPTVSSFCNGDDTLTTIKIDKSIACISHSTRMYTLTWWKLKRRNTMRWLLLVLS